MVLSIFEIVQNFGGRKLDNDARLEVLITNRILYRIRLPDVKWSSSSSFFFNFENDRKPLNLSQKKN